MTNFEKVKKFMQVFGQEVRTKASFPSFCHTWQEKGASIFGGCCGIGPELVAEMIATLKQ